MPQGRAKVPGAKGLLDWHARHCRGMKPPAPPRTIPMSEIAEHNTPASFWMVLKGAVYDITEFQHYHPGGVDIMLPAAGTDGTALFNQYHKWVNEASLLESVLVGYVAPEAKGPPPPAANVAVERVAPSGTKAQPGASAQPLLSPAKFTDFTVAQKTSLTHDTSLFRLQGPSSTVLSLPLCGHVHIAGRGPDNATVTRSYTPIHVGPGTFDILVKKYPDGVVSTYIHGKEPGDVLRCRGPFASPFLWAPDDGCTHLAMLAGGTGIAPFVLLTEHILRTAPQCRMTLVACCRSERDILLSPWLAKCMAENPAQFRVHQVLSQPEGRSELVARGHITRQFLRSYLPPHSQGVRVVLCGPTPFMDHCCGLLQELGFDSGSYTCLGA